MLMFIINDIANGLAFLHASNIFHRDLKSPNVLISEHNRAKLSDFGLAKVKKETQSIAAEGPVGTYEWMAPELISGGTYTNKADIFSFGIILWEIASRKAPYATEIIRTLIPTKVAQGYREQIPPATPKKISSLMRFCWHTDPTHRPTAPQVVEYLRSDEEEFKAAPVVPSAVPFAASSIQGNLDSVGGSMQGNLWSGPR